jgi:hypothetical protein
MLFLPLVGLSQPYGDEWINYNQEYYKINVPEDGIYKIDYNTLQSVGFPAIDPRNIQLFRRGQEVAIEVSGESDGSFDPADFIQFYGQKNDGKLDASLYIDPAFQPHQYESLYADSSAYFLTYNSSFPHKRMNITPTFSGPTPDDYIIEEVITVLHVNNQFARGVSFGSNTSLTQFDQGEGFTGPEIIEIGRPEYDITLNNVQLPFTAGPLPELELLLVGRNDEIDHTAEIFIGPDYSNLSSLGTYSFSGFSTLKISNNIAWSSISASGEIAIRITVLDNGGDRSRISLSYAKLKYPRLTDVNNETYSSFETVVDTGGKALFFTNTTASSKLYDVSDPNNVQLVPDIDSDVSSITCGFSSAAVVRNLVLAEPKEVFSIRKVGFREIDPQDHNYIIISHPRIMKSAGGYPNIVKEYAGYRSTQAGGGFDTLVVDITRLYNQYSYGQPTPLAIYNFMADMVRNGNPKFLFIIGKGLDIRYRYHRKDSSDFTYKDLVPTAGSPGSDLVYTVGLGTNPNNFAVPSGRLSVMTPDEVLSYYNKVVEKESKPYDALWRKDLLHLSGGNSSFELQVFKAYIDGFADIAADHYLGGETTSISKATTASVEFINVSEEVNDGVNIITFFGHSAPDVTDVDIGFVSDPVNGYNNKGKYPLILMNGCNTGNIYEDQFIFGEDWISAANKGATGVIAHSSFGYPTLLKIWTETFYSYGYADSIFIEKPIGEIMEKGSEAVLLAGGDDPNYLVLAQAQQMGLQGDPAVKLFGSYIPDFEITASNVEAIGLTRNGITSDADSFAIALGVRNFGAFIKDSLSVFVRRTLQDGSVVDYDTITYPPARYIDTLVYTIDNEILNNEGNNSFEIILDPGNIIEEHDEFNNIAVFDLFIPTAGTINLLPAPYSIVNDRSVDFAIQSGNTLADSRGYLVELDSDNSFGSSFYKSTLLTGQKVLSWNDVDLLSLDSTAYYWRSKYEVINPNEEDIWTESSFSYIENGGEGWAQLRFPQMVFNKLSGLELNQNAKSIDFLETNIAVEISVHGANSPDFDFEDTKLAIDGLPFILNAPFSLCGNDKLNIVAFNKENAAPYAPIPGNQVQPWTCGRSPQVINSFNSGVSLEDILNAINDGDKVIIFTTGSFDFNSLDPTLIVMLEELGANASILAAKDPAEPYILVGYKGAGAGNAYTELTADPGLSQPTTEQTISWTGDITGVYAQGSISSVDIGPAVSWDKVTYNMNGVDLDDNYSIDIIGKDFAGLETLILANVTASETDLSNIDNETYPYIRLKLNVSDEQNLTAPQLDNWIVNYEQPAEGYIYFLDNNLTGGLSNTLQEGDSINSRFAFVNITDKNFTDSLTVHYRIFNTDQRKLVADSLKISAPLPGDTSIIAVKVGTRGLVGMNNLEVSVNQQVIPEQVYQNNNLNLEDYFLVNRDESNPILEVSFDGEYIFDGDIVSPNPNIRIVIRDDNQFLLKKDTTGIDIFLKKPCEQCTAERVSLSGGEINWTAETNETPFTIDYTPKDLIDGIYELSVQVQDASGNPSGEGPFLIHFEVVNKSSVTNFYPYPNPFSTSVRFIFTLTGNEVPDQMMIRIFTVSGRVVREITQDELGPLRIGNNATEYAWDGRDEYGDQLANGVYLYKVYIKQNGQDVELRPSSGDRGFKNGYGKMYLLR